jgi:hypothetical protein
MRALLSRYHGLGCEERQRRDPWRDRHLRFGAVASREHLVGSRASFLDDDADGDADGDADDHDAGAPAKDERGVCGSAAPFWAPLFS